MTEDINSYIKRKRKSNAHGNHIEIQAISEIYNRSVEVYCYNAGEYLRLYFDDYGFFVIGLGLVFVSSPMRTGSCRKHYLLSVVFQKTILNLLAPFRFQDLSFRLLLSLSVTPHREAKVFLFL